MGGGRSADLSACECDERVSSLERESVQGEIQSHIRACSYNWVQNVQHQTRTRRGGGSGALELEVKGRLVGIAKETGRVDDGAPVDASVLLLHGVRCFSSLPSTLPLGVRRAAALAAALFRPAVGLKEIIPYPHWLSPPHATRHTPPAC